MRRHGDSPPSPDGRQGNRIPDRHVLSSKARKRSLSPRIEARHDRTGIEQRDPGTENEIDVPMIRQSEKQCDPTSQNSVSCHPMNVMIRRPIVGSFDGPEATAWYILTSGIPDISSRALM
jgi:hypothetical protein